jgi:RIO kinase 1
LVTLWQLGVAVPYPVQIDGTEILMEWITVDGETAPRLAQVRPDPALLRSYYAQLRDTMDTMAREGMVHGDLSAYNILAAGERLVIIDLPQVVDLIGNPTGMDFLLRD